MISTLGILHTLSHLILQPTWETDVSFLFFYEKTEAQNELLGNFPIVTESVIDEIGETDWSLDFELWNHMMWIISTAYFIVIKYFLKINSVDLIMYIFY